MGPAEAASVDPQQRILLAWSAATLSAASAGADLSIANQSEASNRLSTVNEGQPGRTTVGVYVGLATTDYGKVNLAPSTLDTWQ